MPRYRIGETPAPDVDQPASGLEVASAIFGLRVGIGFVYAGLRARQYSLAICGAGLAICSVLYLGYLALF